ncbi:MAG: MFS transporter, partial [Planctomycetales bacterium]|nr:MFS transporter [Planctomycetales bacterium]
MTRGQYVEPRFLRRNLHWVAWEGVAYSVMVGIGETYLAALSLAAGLGGLVAGLITTVPVVGGSLLQMLSPWGVGYCKSYRRWVALSVGMQAVSLVWLTLMTHADRVNTWELFAVATLYWAGGLSAGPAWNAWVEHLVPRRIRPTYFAKRSRYCQIGVLAGTVAGGVLLRWQGAQYTVTTFAWLFGIAAVCRFASVTLLTAQSETPSWMQREPRPSGSITNNWRAIADWDHGTRSLVLYLMAMQTAVYISSPYFTPFMLRVLNLNYLQYMYLI